MTEPPKSIADPSPSIAPPSAPPTGLASGAVATGRATAVLLLIYGLEAAAITSAARFQALHLNLWLLDGIGLGLAALIALKSGTVWARAAMTSQVVAVICLLFPTAHLAMAYPAWAAAHLPAAVALIPGLVVRLDAWRREGFRGSGGR